jgi:hypothetical protein
MQITAYRAGHVLGAAMFMVEIAGMRLLYTGDYSRLSDRHMPTADLPELKPHIGGSVSWGSSPQLCPSGSAPLPLWLPRSLSFSRVPPTPSSRRRLGIES